MKIGSVLFVVILALSVNTLTAQSTTFSYQGNLANAGSPANGNYDLEFALFDLAAGGTQLGATLARNNVVVTNGVFSVSLDFGGQFPGANRFLEIRVRPSSGGAFTPLTPRQVVDSSPYSIKSLNAENAVNATTATNATQLGGVAASQYVLTGDARLSDARNPLAGSASYIQNQNAAPQATSNFNISGTGTANILSAATQFSIGSERVLTVSGLGSFANSNTFAGVGSGTSIALTIGGNGSLNSFFGNQAGASTSSGQSNAFFGYQTGLGNTTGGGNSFFGRNAGTANTTGSQNAFFGELAGHNSTADLNSFFGNRAGFANTTGAGNSFFGAQSGFSTTIGGGNTFFGTASGLNNATGTNNSFFGNGAGVTNTTGSNNTIIGKSADVGANNLTFATAIGANAVVSSSNTITLGRAADTVQVPGGLNVVGPLTAALPSGSGNYIQNQNAAPQATSNFNISGNGTAGGTLSGNVVSASTQFNIGINRAFFANGTGINNTYLGFDAGQPLFANHDNSFVGSSAGRMTGGDHNAFFGSHSGDSNTSGNSNTFIGSSTGRANTTGSANTAIGTGANVGVANLTNATALGANAQVNQTNSLVLGSINGINGATADTSIGIGTTAPTNLLTIGQPEATVVSGRVGIFSSTGTNLIMRETTNNVEGIMGVNSSNGVTYGSMTSHSVNLRTNNTNRLVISSTGLVSIANLGAAGATALCRNASDQISTCSSSARYKSNIAQFNGGLEILKWLRPISFNWKDGGMLDLGLVAEDVAKIEPLLITTNDKGDIEGVKYDRIGVVLINAVKEQQTQIEAQEKEIERQRSENERLKAELEMLKQFVCRKEPAAAFCRQDK